MITYLYKIAFKSALRDVGMAAALGVVNEVVVPLPYWSHHWPPTRPSTPLGGMP